MANKKIIEDGMNTRFTRERQPLKNGRKPKLYTIAKKTYGISFEEFKDVVNYLVQCPKKELNEISEKEDTPIWMVNVCRALYKDTGKGVINTLRELIALMWGKEMAAKFDITTNGRDIGQQIVFSPTPLSEQDIQEIKDIQYGKKDSDDTGVSET